jgi:hypothetical protein
VSWRLSEFEQYFANILGGKPTSFAKYRSFLNRTDQLAGGLDDMVAAQGIDGTRNWAKNQTEPPFDKFPSDARSIVNSYLGFLKEVSQLDPLLVVAPTDKLTGDVTQGGIAFKIEKEMQAAIRKDLDALESGLIAIDEGIEVSTATGRVDILARDKSGILTVIELKAGSCPSGAIEQVLGYAQSLSDEREEKTRAILIAASFSERQKAATKRTVGLSLKTYSYSLSYENQM